MAEKKVGEETEGISIDEKQLSQIVGRLFLGTLLHGLSPQITFPRAKKIETSLREYQKSNGNIAAIDFGTTSVSLAFTTVGDEKISTLTLDVDSKDTRVPNALLLHLKEDRSVIVQAFGHEARNKYGRLRSSDLESHVYFEQIKLFLKRDKNIDRQTIVESFNGQNFYLLEIIALILKYLKDCLIKHLSTGFKRLKTTDFDWVITVPAIWDARGKRMMREAAYLADLLTEGPGITQLTPTTTVLCRPDEKNPAKLSLALEPEAAAIYSQKATSQQAASLGSAPLIGSYMVIDIGGGTVDITVQEEVNGGIEVKSIPTGKSCGGTDVNILFSKFIQNLVQDDNFSRFHQSKYKAESSLHKLHKQFEDIKLEVGDKKQGEREKAISLPNDFINFYTEEVIKGRVEEVEFLEYDDDTIYLSSDMVEANFFEPIVKDIMECVLSVIESVKEKIGTIYLVGGFGGCKYIFERLKEDMIKTFGSIDCRIIVPTSPKLAIAQGAVMWRRDPSIITARRADATYGTDVAQPFMPLIHDPHYCGVHPETKELLCGDIFKVFIEKGDTVKSNEIFTTEIAPGSISQASATFDILSTQETGIAYIKDKEGKPLVKKVGELVIDMPNPDKLPNHERMVEISMSFSETEMQAKAKYLLTGEEVKTVCDFLSAQNE